LQSALQTAYNPPRHKPKPLDRDVALEVFRKDIAPAAIRAAWTDFIARLIEQNVVSEVVARDWKPPM
jgi:hypothetical protein